MTDISLKLWNKNSGEVYLGLRDKYPDWRKEEISEYAIEAESGYKFELYPLNNIKLAKIFVNDTLIGRFLRSGDELEFRVQPNGSIENLPFLLYFGYVVLRVEITYDDNNHDVLYTKYIDVVSRYDDTNKCAEGLLNEIERYNDSRLGDWVFNKIIDSNRKEQKYSWWYGSLHSKSNRYIDAYIELLKDILDKYRQNFSFFKINAYHKIEYHQKVVSYEKIRKCAQSDFQWLMQNADHFAPINKKIGIKYQNQYYMPNNIMGDEQFKNFDIYENQIVMGFLLMVLNNCEQICKKLSQSVENIHGLIKKHVNVRDYFSISLLTLKCNIRSEWIQQLYNLRREFHMLWSQYNKIWSIKKVNNITKMPHITKVFQEVRYYRDIYEAVRRWFEFGEFSLIRFNVMLKIKTIDVLYEYYCLYKLLEMLIDNGWLPIQNGIFSDFYPYSHDQQEDEICNTYHFQKDDKRLSLYYQAKIFSWECMNNNNINIFRTTRDGYNRQSSWSPDFVIKLQTSDTEKYIILDAKYSNLDNIRDYLLPECIDKYINQTSCKNNSSAIRMMVLLQGKTRESDKFLNYHNSDMAKKYFTGPTVGIMPFSFQNKTSDLYAEIRNALHLSDL